MVLQNNVRSHSVCLRYAYRKEILDLLLYVIIIY